MPQSLQIVPAAAIAAAVALGSAVSGSLIENPTPPVWPDRWVAQEDVTVQEGKQKATSSSTSYFDLPNNRSAQTNLTHSQFDTIVTLFDGDGGQGQEYYIRTYKSVKDPAPTRHCQFWCNPSGGGIPCNAGDSLCSFDYKKKAKYFGQRQVDGKETNVFYWTENLGPVPMNSLELYTTTDTPAMPVRMFRDIHPFGKKLGNSTIDYASFAAQTTPFDEAIFDLGPDAKYACAEAEPDPQCQSAQAFMRQARGEAQAQVHD